MPSTDTPQYHAVAKTIHWLTAFTIIALLAVGWVMTGVDGLGPLKFDLFQWHKSLGITVLLLSIVRVAWRVTHTPPPMPEGMARWEKAAAVGVHHLFYLLIIVMPMTGWVIVSTSKHAIPTKLFYLIPWPALPILPTLENKNELNDFFSETHETLALIIAGLVVLHAGAALKHHFISRDDTLTRMAPKFLTGFLNRFGGAKPLALLVLMAALATTSPAMAKNWTVDYAHSRLGFSAEQEHTKFDGQFRKFTATIDFDPEHPETGKITATIDIASITAGTDERDGYLPQKDWFDTKAFPQAVFASKSIHATGNDGSRPGENCYAIDGTLTIKGVTKPVTMPFCLYPEGDHYHAEGKLPMLRTDYNVGLGQWADDDFIKHAVNVTFDIIAKPN